ncbi:ABC transporter permease [Rhizobium laguerreae]|uniref:ABC transporter permease n=1 Tax=Rhizobium laguerreae TaxID=1076926 RepID=UPI001C90E681|nr:ABC transporter permease [Rhizobium laguerreae]MBY3101252.1 ABC transporter permease [Rhizobium laguerreae]
MYLKSANRLLVGFLFLFLLAPVIMVFPISLSGDNYISWPPSSWSFRWYEALLNQPQLGRALINSLTLAAIVTVLSLVIGLMVAFVLVRYPFRGRDTVMSLFSLPLILPTIVLGIGLLMLFAERGWQGTWTGLVIGHMTITLPYAIRILTTSLKTLPADIEAAAASLGASPWRVIRHVTVPLIASGITAAGTLSFLVSFDEVVISIFIVGPRLMTFPVELYNMVYLRSDPLVAAVSGVLVLATLLVVIMLERLIGLRNAIGNG